MPSMGSVGDAYDNAMAESFFATLERELLNRHRFKTQTEARMAVRKWVKSSASAFGVKWFQIPPVLLCSVVVHLMEIPGMWQAFRRKANLGTQYR